MQWLEKFSAKKYIRFTAEKQDNNNNLIALYSSKDPILAFILRCIN